MIMEFLQNDEQQRVSHTNPKDLTPGRAEETKTPGLSTYGTKPTEKGREVSRG